MKIKIKRKLLKENKLNSYSNVWKRWKTIDDFNEWNRTQVLALAKYKKGQGRFDFKLYDKVYEDLKEFLTRAKEITQKEPLHSADRMPPILRDMDVKDNIKNILILKS